MNDTDVHLPQRGQADDGAARSLLDVSLRGVLQRFVYRDETKGFAIASLRDEADGQVWTVKGSLWGVEAGETVQIWGRFEEDPRWGKQFRVDSAQPVLPVTADGVVHYLVAAKIRGVGETLARRIVDELGAGALQRIREQPALLKKIKGLSGKRGQALAALLQSRAEAEERYLFLYGLGLGPALAARIAGRYGAETVRKIREDPHRLADDVQGVGFRTADRVARALGTAVDAPGRLRAGLRFVLHDLAQHGHTAPPRRLVLERAAAALEVDPAGLEPVLQALCAESVLVDLPPVSRGQEAAVALPELYHAERELADRLVLLARRSPHTDDVADLQARLQLAATSLGFDLHGAQRDAVVEALRRGLLVVTGGPGTGKTTIIRGVLAALGPDHVRVVLAAPTGRAARRLGEATGREAKTLHRLLEYDPRQGRFGRDPERPLEADLVIVDEVSMMEAPLAAALCDAVPPGARVLLVGDADQLPSVGPGAVLDDLLRSGIVPSVALDRIYRQGEGSLITLNAHRVRGGELPQSGMRGGDGDFFIVPRDHPEDILQALLEIVAHRLPQRGFDPIDDVQVLAPMHRGVLGTQNLNEALRTALNPDGERLPGGLRVGDKVLQARNDYDLEVFNGDIGRVEGMVQGPRTATSGPRQGQLVSEACLRVRFGDREVQYPQSQLEHLQLAYAVTVHKAQGSEYPAVVLPLHAQHHLLLQRNLLYTALTRGRRFVVVVGQARAIERATANDAPIQRYTRLREELQRASEVPA